MRPTTLPLLGEFITRVIPDKTVVKHSQILAALSVVGLPDKLAGGLSLAEALGRVVKRLASGGIVHNVREGTDCKRFQLDSKVFDTTTNRMRVFYSADIRLDKSTGIITSDDPVIESQARSLITSAQEDVKTTDIARVICRIIAHECGRTYARGNSTVQFFVMDAHRPAADKLEAFLSAIGCSLDRVPVIDCKAVEAMLAAGSPATSIAVSPPSTGCGIPAVVDAIRDGMLSDIYKVDLIIDNLRKATRESTITRECARLLEIADYAEQPEILALIGAQVEVIRDHAALARMRLLKLYSEKKAEEATPAVASTPYEWDDANPMDIEMESTPTPTFTEEGKVRYPRIA